MVGQVVEAMCSTLRDQRQPKQREREGRADLAAQRRVQGQDLVEFTLDDHQPVALPRAAVGLDDLGSVGPGGEARVDLLDAVLVVVDVEMLLAPGETWTALLQRPAAEVGVGQVAAGDRVDHVGAAALARHHLRQVRVEGGERQRRAHHQVA